MTDLTRKIEDFQRDAYERLNSTERAIVDGARESALLNLLDGVMSMVARQRTVIAGHLVELLPPPAAHEQPMLENDAMDAAIESADNVPEFPRIIRRQQHEAALGQAFNGYRKVG